MAIIGYLRDCERFGCPYYLDCVILTAAHPSVVYCPFHFCKQWKIGMEKRQIGTITMFYAYFAQRQMKQIKKKDGRE